MTATETTRSSGKEPTVESAKRDLLQARLNYIRQIVDTDEDADIDELNTTIDEARVEIQALTDLVDGDR